MILDLFRLDGKVAIVTGAGRGIGAASALALAQCGADVVIVSRTQRDLDAVVAQVQSTGRRAISVAGDVADLGVVRSLVEVAREEFGRLDVVVNNAGEQFPFPSWTRRRSISRRPSTSTSRPPTRSISTPCR